MTHTHRLLSQSTMFFKKSPSRPAVITLAYIHQQKWPHSLKLTIPVMYHMETCLLSSQLISVVLCNFNETKQSLKHKVQSPYRENWVWIRSGFRYARVLQCITVHKLYWLAPRRIGWVSLRIWCYCLCFKVWYCFNGNNFFFFFIAKRGFQRFSVPNHIDSVGNIDGIGKQLPLLTVIKRMVKLSLTTLHIYTQKKKKILDCPTSGSGTDVWN